MLSMSPTKTLPRNSPLDGDMPPQLMRRLLGTGFNRDGKTRETNSTVFFLEAPLAEKSTKSTR